MTAAAYNNIALSPLLLTKPKKKSFFSKDNLIPLVSGIGIGIAGKALLTTALTPLGLGAVAGAAFSFGSIMKNNWTAGQGLKNFSATNLKSIFSDKSNRRKMYIAAAFGAAGVTSVFADVDIIPSAEAAECAVSDSGNSVKSGAGCLQIGTNFDEPAEHHNNDGHRHLPDSELLPPAEIETQEPAKPAIEEIQTEWQPSPIRVNDEDGLLSSSTSGDIINDGVGQEVPIVPPFEEYTLTSDDVAGLGRIAAEHYGLTDQDDIISALNHIAHANCMDENDINWVKEGQTIRLPSSIDGSVPSLNWYEVVQEAKAGPDSYWDGDVDSCTTTDPVPEVIPEPTEKPSGWRESLRSFFEDPVEFDEPAEPVEDLGTTVIQEPVRVGDGSTLKDGFGEDVVTEREVPLVPSFEEYTLTSEDSAGLGRIAAEHYGLTEQSDILNALSHIAQANCMDENDINWVREGQTIRLPLIDGSAPSLNLHALSEGFKAGPDYWDGNLGNCAAPAPVPAP